ncbi:MAG: hypothetical protein FJ291_26105 [Planctomycetes bacterium]|nr:hypothetical protein [Planctomycetota bacterium]
MSTVKARSQPGALPGDPLTREAAAFRRKLPALLVAHKGEYVAFYHGRLVGHGADDEELADRMFRKLGDAPFYIARVEQAPTVCEAPSPEVIG